MFAEAFNAFGGANIKVIRGTWIDVVGLRDNFVSFKNALAAGATEEEAAFRTFTGKMAYRAGFRHAEIESNTAKEVLVKFTR